MATFNSPVTGAGAIALSVAVPTGQRRRLVSITGKIGVAPVSAGSLTVTLNSNAGSAYDAQIYSDSMVGVTSYARLVDGELWLIGGDAVDLAYTNPDGRTCGFEIRMEG